MQSSGSLVMSLVVLPPWCSRRSSVGYVSGCRWMSVRMSSQDYIYDRGITPLATNYLGVTTASNDTSQTSVTGQSISYTLAYPFTNFSDTVNGASVTWTGNAGNAATEDSGRAATFWGFPWKRCRMHRPNRLRLAYVLGQCPKL